MPKRTLVASIKGIEKAKYALIRKNWTQQALADDVQVASWATISKFFNGVPISYSIFTEICTMLELDWQDIAISSNPNITEAETQEPPLTALAGLWHQLQLLGSPTEKMGLVLVKEETLGWRWQTTNIYEKSVSIGSHIRFEINLESSGYLLLIQKNTSQELWCFCPSCFAPQSHLTTGKTSLPQEDSVMKSFYIEGNPGQEQILAIITKDMPNLNWLPQGSDNPLQLEETRLRELLAYLSTTKDSEIFYTDYLVKS
jgi:DNA-binding Xre family transcriptional regulator